MTDSGELKPLQHQVAGHPSSVLASATGEWILKPSLPLELEFYATTAPTHFPELIEKGYIPKYYGSQAHAVLDKEGSSSELDKAIKLENLTHGFAHPNVMDIKLGTQLYDPLDEKLTPEKQARMEQAALDTTSGSDGLRLTGFTVYDEATSSYVSTAKQYGKALKSADLMDGIRRFFPCAQADKSSYPDNALTSPPPAGLDAQRLLPTLEEVLSTVEGIYAITSKYEWRVYAGSLLIVYEGGKESSTPPATVKLIDFAHTRYLKGQGPDEGQCKGFESVIRLLKERIEEVKKL